MLAGVCLGLVWQPVLVGGAQFLLGRLLVGIARRNCRSSSVSVNTEEEESAKLDPGSSTTS